MVDSSHSMVIFQISQDFKELYPTRYDALITLWPSRKAYVIEIAKANVGKNDEFNGALLRLLHTTEEG